MAKYLDKAAQIAQYLPSAAALLYLGTYIYVALARMGYPFELEAMEGGSLLEVVRILSGLPLYAAPTPEWVPFIYPPIYFYVSAALAAVIGIGFLPLRLVSFVSSLGVLTLIFKWVHEETGSLFPATVAAGLFAASFRVTGAWLDIARVDSLALFLLLAAFYLIRKQSVPAHLVAGLLFALACLTKSTVLPALFPLSVCAVVTYRRSGLYFSATAIRALLTGSLVLDELYGGWFKFYIFDLPGQHIPALLSLPKLALGIVDVLMPFSAACILLIYSAFFSRIRFSRDYAFSAMLIAGMGGISLAERLNAGSYDNALIPAAIALSIVTGLGLGRIARGADSLRNEERHVVEVVTYLLVSLQFALIWYPPLAQIPTQADLDAGNHLVDVIRRVDGPVLIPTHPYLAWMAAKNIGVHTVALMELSGDFGEGDLGEGARVKDEIEAQVRAEQFGAIILDTDGLPWLDMQDRYERARLLHADDERFWPVTGYPARPQFIYYRKAEERGEENR